MSDRPEKARSPKTLDQKKGWCDLTWGSAPLPDMTLIRSPSKHETQHLRKIDWTPYGNTEFLLRGYRLGHILHFFWKNQFYMVVVPVWELFNATRILRVLEEAYGKPSKLPTHDVGFGWHGDDVWAIYTEDKRLDMIFVCYLYRPLHREVERAARQQRRESLASSFLEKT